MSTTSERPSSPFFSNDFDRLALEEFDNVGGSRLQIEEQIAKTPFAAVFHALDRHTGREVAVKVFECPSDKEDVWRKTAARIRREVQAWIALENKHPYIMQLLDVLCHKVVTPDQSFIAIALIMPLAPLGDLKKYIQHHAPNGLEMTVGRLRTFLLHIAGALEAVHLTGSVHKDIKSSNILLFPGRRESDTIQELTPKLSDFGITQKTLDASHGLEGTPEYMAPEAFRDGYEPNLPSDIYSLGILFYEIITGSAPYKAAGLSVTERFAAYEKLHKSGAIDFLPIRAKMGHEMASLLKDMVSIDVQQRPKIRQIASDLSKQIVIAEYGEITAQEGTKAVPWNTYRWNPHIHEKLGDRLSYYFLKGQNSKGDPLWIGEALDKAGIRGYSLYRVIGGIDYLLRIWETPGVTSNVIAQFVSEFRRLQHGLVLRFKVEGFHSISSVPKLSFPRFDKDNVCKVIFDNMNANREAEFEALSQAGLVAGRLGCDATKESHPLRLFVAFRIGEHGTHSTNMRIFAREIYESLLPIQEEGKTASISTYWGEDAYSLLIKLRLKRFEDYEVIWEECMKAIDSINEAVTVQSETYLEVNRVSVCESDDGSVWREVDKYRADHRLNWPNSM